MLAADPSGARTPPVRRARRRSRTTSTSPACRRPRPARPSPYAPARSRPWSQRARGRRRDPRRQDQPRPVRDRARRHALALRRRAQRVRSALHLAAARARARPSPSPRGSSHFALGTDTAGSGRVPAGLQQHRRLEAHARAARRRAASCRRADRSTACRSSRSPWPTPRACSPPCDGPRRARSVARALPLDRRALARARSRFGVPQRDQREFFGDARVAAAFDARASTQLAGARRRCAARSTSRRGARRRRCSTKGRWSPSATRRCARSSMHTPDALDPTGARHHRAARALLRDRRLRRRARAARASCAQRARAAVGRHRRAGRADRAHDLHDRGGAGRAGRAQPPPRRLHQLRQPARPRGDRGAGGAAQRRPAVRHHADRAAPAATSMLAELGAALSRTPPACRSARPARRCRAAEPLAAARRHVASGRRRRRAPLGPAAQSRADRARRARWCARRAPRRAIASTRCPAPCRPSPGWCASRTATARAIEVEVWEMPLAAFGAFVAAIPAPLCIGTIELDDGSAVQGFLCEAAALDGRRRHLALRRLAPLHRRASPAHRRPRAVHARAIPRCSSTPPGERDERSPRLHAATA